MSIDTLSPWRPKPLEDLGEYGGENPVRTLAGFFDSPYTTLYLMETGFLLVSAGLFAIAAMLFVVYKKITRSGESKAGEDSMFLLLQNQLQELNRTMSRTHEQLHQTIQSQFGHSAKIITDVTEKLTKLDETNRQVVSFTDQVKNLERVLTNSKNRGSMGESSLELILGNILPPGTYQMQYRFPDGDIVDAVVFIKDQILPVDAKFSLDNYRRILDEIDPAKKELLEKEFKNDLKKRIDETAKYIKPKDGTLDFAFMFIPAEGIYYDLLINEVGAVKVNTRSLIEYAFKEKKVVIVSPTTFAAYLQTVLQGLRAMKIEESAKEIQKNVENLGKHMAAYEEYFRKLGNNLGTTVSSYNQAYKELGKIDKDVFKIAGGEKTIEPMELDRPQGGD